MRFLTIRPRLASSFRFGGMFVRFVRRWAVIAVAISGAVGASACGPATSEHAPTLTEAPLANTINSAGAQVVVTTPVADGLGGHKVVVGYSRTDDIAIVLNGEARMVRRNASRMYRALLTPESNTWSGGRVSAPAGWPVLWGEPAITRNRADPNLIYLTNVAVPNAKFPAVGYIINELEHRTDLPAAYCKSYLGGACIARSTDGGRVFTTSDADCVRRITDTCTEGTPYVATALETSPEGRVYAAYTDHNRYLVDVYMASTPTGPFARITDSPIARVGAFMGPRLKYGPGGLYLLVQGPGSLYLTRYDGGSSHTGTWTPSVLVATGLSNATVNFGADMAIEPRTQYDLDIGPSGLGTVEVRIAYATFNAGVYRVRVARCTTGTPITCTSPPEWAPAVPLGQDRFGPTIAYVPSTDGTIKWTMSWYDRRNAPDGFSVELWRGSLRVDPYRLIDQSQEPREVPCPSTRGYWGYYDGMAAGPDGFTVRGFSRSPIIAGQGCIARGYYSNPLAAAVSSWTE